MILVAVGFAIALVAVAIYQRRHGATRACRWREDRAGSRGALIKYTCVHCGAEAFRSTGTPDRCMAKSRMDGKL